MKSVALPYAGKRQTPDTSRLSQLYLHMGEALADTALRKGTITQQGLAQLGQIFTNYSDGKRAERQQGEAMATRQREREDERTFNAEQGAAERAARAAERDAERQQRQSEREAEAEIRQSERAEAATTGAVGATRPGVVKPEFYEQVKRLAPAMASRFQVLDGAPVLMQTPEQARQASIDAAAAEERKAAGERAKADDVRADKALALATRKANETPVTASEPLMPIVGADGKTRYGTRAEARGTVVPAGAEKPSSGVQKRALAFYNRAAQADKDLEALESGVQKMGLVDQGRLKFAPNFAQTEQGQLYNQAQRAFTEARLRKDSGAAIPENEFESDRTTYFPQPGDTVANLEQKRRARAAMLASLAFESGQALGEFIGDPEEAKSLIESYRQRAASPVTVGQVPNNGTVVIDGFTVRVKPGGWQ